MAVSESVDARYIPARVTGGTSIWNIPEQHLPVRVLVGWSPIAEGRVDVPVGQIAAWAVAIDCINAVGRDEPVDATVGSVAAATDCDAARVPLAQHNWKRDMRDRSHAQAVRGEKL